MRFIDEYRDPDAAAGYARALRRITTRPWTLMEVCGGQTHAIVKFGVDELLPPEVTLVHGPGCPVCVTPLEEGRAEVENQYARAVRRDGNQPAQQLVREVFRVVPRKWRGVGEIPQSGLALARPYQSFDAELRFGIAGHTADEPTECCSGLIMQGLMKPRECSAFGTRCTPEHPLGATMVSSEGACAAYHHYRRLDIPRQEAEVATHAD
ncbi:MAG: hypothetical protein A3J29_06595 [Acidobacteria bacterium RIFCSPLOWO2_12_FULL_67_14b]|nr:MAG: hypothetical protein A3J29_06595 [Acidobacteria bacterium RIFCSPLOWO2_12_FULL_67_14b]